ncbi:MAG TPA: PQQ-binding-like beta-propeller repeat protein, partial [Bryobacteraceae bacterium]|nr:PQQ-binding-like beta-propeller repeat protein [Bryobacteraceae bacterium]
MRAKPVAALVLAFVFAPASLPAENWPFFRGPSRQGTSAEKGLPRTWSSTDNIAWKTATPGFGWSSPVIWGKRVFLTAATEDGASCHILSLDADGGKILWDREVLQQPVRRKEKKNSYATPTPATDGRRVYAVFADGSIVAVDYSGRVLWTNRDHSFYSQHGLGASPVLHRNLLIMAYDGSSDGEDKKIGWQKPWDRSYVVALDTATGKERWRARRGLSRIAHVTPNIATVDGKQQLVSAAGDVIQGFDLSDGKLLWTVRSQGEGVVPSVVIGDGLAFTSSGFEKTTMRAVRLSGAVGDATASHIAWEQTKGVSHIPSFLFVRPWLFSVTEGGIAMAQQASTGRMVWQQRLGGEYSSSPVHGDGAIYFVSETCET